MRTRVEARATGTRARGSVTKSVDTGWEPPQELNCVTATNTDECGFREKEVRGQHGGERGERGRRQKKTTNRLTRAS